MSRQRGRLAPSPTGGLHVGNVRTLMLAWLAVRAAAGRVVLRIEDIDRARCKPGWTAQMIDDLRWLGFDWEEGPDTGGQHAPYEQSQRTDRYRAALARLIAAGYAFPCVCSRADLAAAASAPHGPEGPVYPGTCRDRFRDAGDAAAAGRPPAWRFDSRRCPAVPWRDPLQPERVMPEAVDDFVLWRADGVPSYQLAVVVDDLAMEITEVVRGDDLAGSTPRQLALIRALGGQAPAYRHVALVLDEAGRRLAKRSGATQIAELRRLGVTAQQILGVLAMSAGLVPSAEPVSLTALAEVFAWSRVPSAPVCVAEEDLRGLAPTRPPSPAGGGGPGRR
jgi:glutamyl-tRNA synthetase